MFQRRMPKPPPRATEPIRCACCNTTTAHESKVEENQLVHPTRRIMCGNPFNIHMARKRLRMSAPQMEWWM